MLGKIAKRPFFVPVLSSSAVIGTVWNTILNGGHPAVKAIFGVFGIDPTLLLGSSKTAFIAVAFIIVWKGMGYYMVITLASLTSISDTFYETKVDGATKMGLFNQNYITTFETYYYHEHFLSTISAMQVFDMVYTMTGGGPSMSTTTLSMYAYQLTFKGNKSRICYGRFQCTDVDCFNHRIIPTTLY